MAKESERKNVLKRKKVSEERYPIRINKRIEYKKEKEKRALKKKVGTVREARRSWPERCDAQRAYAAPEREGAGYKYRLFIHPHCWPATRISVYQQTADISTYEIYTLTLGYLRADWSSPWRRLRSANRGVSQ